MKVSLISGILKQKDAISSSSRAKVRALVEIFQSLGESLDVRIYVNASDYEPADSLRIVTNVNDIIFDEHFISSDFVIYEFGIHYNLFNTIFLVPPPVTKVVHFHNITPPEFVEEYNREFIRMSLVQRVNILEADIVLSTSAFNTRELIDFGVNKDKIFPLYPVPVSVNATTQTTGPVLEPDKGRPGMIEATYVGRFVHSKGVHDLLEALRLTLDSGAENIHLNLIGSRELSDDSFYSELKSRVQKLELENHVDILEGLSDEERDSCYRRSHLFLTASYHEGFCVPVLEALKHGCYVIAYDAGNLRNVINGLGNTVATGDVNALSEKIIDYMRIKNSGDVSGEAVLLPDAGPMCEAEFLCKVNEYLLNFSEEEFKNCLLEMLNRSVFKHRQPGILA